MKTYNEDSPIFNLLQKIRQEACQPSEEEKGMLAEIKDDIEDFADHWDEGENHKTPFVYLHMLDKMASKNMVYENVDLASLSSLLKKIHGRRYGFDPCVFDKDSEGRFLTLCETTNGKELRPIELSLSAYLDAFVDKIFEYNAILNKI